MPSIDPVKFDELKNISGADFISELIDTFLEDTPKLVEEIKSAMEANNADAYRRAAHSLKSNAATFGAGQLAELAKDLETIGRENRLMETGDRLNILYEAAKSACDELRGLKL